MFGVACVLRLSVSRNELGMYELLWVWCRWALLDYVVSLSEVVISLARDVLVMNIRSIRSAA